MAYPGHIKLSPHIARKTKKRDQVSSQIRQHRVTQPSCKLSSHIKKHA